MLSKILVVTSKIENFFTDSSTLNLSEIHPLRLSTKGLLCCYLKDDLGRERSSSRNEWQEGVTNSTLKQIALEWQVSINWP